jgi:RimJ/RimL family protein N-acetyltransferase
VNTKALPGEFSLRDGTPAMIWPLLPTDARMLREGFRRLSPESRRRRFLSPLDDLDDAMIARLVTGVDGVHHIALVLVALPPDGPEEPVGIARLVQDPSDPATADIAVTVADRWQGRGVGAALVRALMKRRPRELRQIRTVVDADNRASLALLAASGVMSPGPARAGVVDVTVELPAA